MRLSRWYLRFLSALNEYFVYFQDRLRIGQKRQRRRHLLAGFVVELHKTQTKAKCQHAANHKDEARRDDDVAHTHQRRNHAPQHEDDGTHQRRGGSRTLVSLVHGQGHTATETRAYAGQHRQAQALIELEGGAQQHSQKQGDTEGQQADTADKSALPRRLEFHRSPSSYAKY